MIEKWENSKASPAEVKLNGIPRSSDILHSLTYCPKRRYDLTLGDVDGVAAVRTGLRLPKSEAPKAMDITSVIREALGPITPTLARKQIKRAFTTPDIPDDIFNVKSNGYP